MRQKILIIDDEKTALLTNIDNKPVLARILENFPKEAEIIIALASNKTLEEFVSLAYPERKIKFLDVLCQGKSLADNIIAAKPYLQCPFVICSAKFLMHDAIPKLTCNWIGYTRINDNPALGNVCLVGINDYAGFWRSSHTRSKILSYFDVKVEIQSIFRMRMGAIPFSGFDLEDEKDIETAKKFYITPDSPNVLPKQDEEIWFIEDKVIKFHQDSEFITGRIQRALELKGYVPDTTGHTTHMYSYSYVDGVPISRNISFPLFGKLLDFLKTFWEERELTNEESNSFHDDCYTLYKTKTLDRVDAFYKKFNRCDNAGKINGICYPSLDKMLNTIDWNSLTHGIPGRAHGDLHFENIIYNESDATFKFIDWRQNFGRSNIFDVYYDLSKLVHGLVISHEVIAKEAYAATWINNELKYDFYRKQILVDCEQYYFAWLEKNGYDAKKVKKIISLFFLSCAVLHHEPYCFLLYGLGKKLLYDALKNEEV